MTQLVEEITIKITLNHCEGDSVVLGGGNDLRARATTMLRDMFPRFIESRDGHGVGLAKGVKIDATNTGLYEVPELGGGDN